MNVPRDPSAADVLILAKEVFDRPTRELRTMAFQGVIDALLRARLDSVLCEALSRAPSRAISQLLRDSIERAIRHVATVAAGTEVQSNIFCAAVIIRFTEPVTCAEFDRTFKRISIAEFMNVPTLPRCPFDTWVAEPTLFTFEELASLSFSSQRMVAAQILEQHVRPASKFTAVTLQTCSPHRRSRHFLRYVVGNRIDLNDNPPSEDECRRVCNSLNRSFKYLADGVESVRCECDGTWFQMLRSGWWLYQMACLEDVVRNIASDRLTKRALTATISAHRFKHTDEVRIGFFRSGNLILPHAYYIRPVADSSPQQYFLEISQAISRSGIKNVREFRNPHCERSGDDRRAILLNPHGQLIASHMLLPL